MRCKREERALEAGTVQGSLSLHGFLLVLLVWLHPGIPGVDDLADSGGLFVSVLELLASLFGHDHEDDSNRSCWILLICVTSFFLRSTFSGFWQ